jgi:hypothetical protein
VPEVLSEIVFPVRNGRNQFDGQFANGIGIDNNGWARFPNLGANGRVKVHQPDFATFGNRFRVQSSLLLEGLAIRYRFGNGLSNFRLGLGEFSDVLPLVILGRLGVDLSRVVGFQEVYWIAFEILNTG